MCTPCARAALLALLQLGLAPAQAPAPALVAAAPLSRGELLPVDDPELYFSFFRFHADFHQWLDGRKAANPRDGGRLDQLAAARFGLDLPSLPKLLAISRELVAYAQRMEALAEAHRRAAQATGRRPDPLQVREFERQRQMATQHAVQRLRADLPPPALAGLRAYVNGEHRQAVRRIRR